MIRTISWDAIFALVHEFLNREGNRISLTSLYKMTGVSPAKYHNWVNTMELRQEREEYNKKDLALVLDAYTFRGYDKGVHGIYMHLLHCNPPVIMHHMKITRLMRELSFHCPVREPGPSQLSRRMPQTSKDAPDNNHEFTARGRY